MTTTRMHDYFILTDPVFKKILQDIAKTFALFFNQFENKKNCNLTDEKIDGMESESLQKIIDDFENKANEIYFNNSARDKKKLLAITTQFSVPSSPHIAIFIYTAIQHQLTHKKKLDETTNLLLTNICFVMLGRIYKKLAENAILAKDKENYYRKAIENFIFAARRLNAQFNQEQNKFKLARKQANNLDCNQSKSIFLISLYEVIAYAYQGVGDCYRSVGDNLKKMPAITQTSMFREKARQQAILSYKNVMKMCKNALDNGDDLPKEHQNVFIKQFEDTFFKRFAIKNLSTQEACIKFFFKIRKQKMNDQWFGFFHCLQRSSLNGTENLAGILANAFKKNNRTRKILVEDLRWLDADNKLTHNAPKPVRDAYDSLSLRGQRPG